MADNDVVLSVVKEVLGREPDLGNSFVEEGGDSFNAIVLMERLEGILERPISLESLLSDEPIRSVLGIS